MRAGIAELKASLSEYVRRVSAGEEIVITDHGRPVARLMPYERQGGPDSEEIERLIADGILAPPKEAGSERLLADLQALRRPAPPGVSLVEAILEERESGY
jgi:prevent-host-death family protein